MAFWYALSVSMGLEELQAALYQRPATNSIGSSY